MSDEELRVTRRRFLRHSAVAAAAAGGFPSIALKTDALAQVPPEGFRPFGTDDNFPYPYANP